MNEIFQQALKEIPTIGDKVISVQNNEIIFESGKKVMATNSPPTINDVVIEAYYKLDIAKNELFVWFELSSGTGTDANVWSTYKKYERSLKLDKIVGNINANMDS